MILQMAMKPAIEDLGKHSPQVVEELGALLLSGALAYPDPRRRNFFEVQDYDRVFYVHVSPVNSKVMLLAIWRRDIPAGSYLDRGEEVYSASPAA